MATLKLKPKTSPANPGAPTPRSARPPVRGVGSCVRARPTLAQAQAERSEREARYQAELRGRQAAGPGGRPSARRRDTDAPRAAGAPDAPPRGRVDPRGGPRRDAPPSGQRSGGSGPRREAGGRSDETAFAPRPGGARADAGAFAPRPAGARPEGRTADRRDGPWAGDRPPRRQDDAHGPGPPGRAGRPPAHRQGAEPAFEPTRAPERSSRRPSPTWNEPAATERPPRPGRPPAAGPNTAFGARPPSRPVRPPLEPARRHLPAPDAPDAPPAPTAAPTSAAGSLRLSKYMGELGIASRREADEWIAKGWVRVDGQVVSELGSRVLRGQHVTVDARARHVQAQKVTVLVHKPVGYVSGQAEDGYEPALVLVKPANQWSEDRSGTRWLPQHLRSLVPAGRLDIDSVGLLVLTQDGRVAKQLIGEHSDVEKEYLVRVAALEGHGALGDEGLALLRHGLELDGEPLREAVVEWVNEDQLRFVLREGRKRQIRRMCEAVGLKVLGLKRVRIGRVMLGDLPAGQWRYLRPDEGFA